MRQFVRLVFKFREATDLRGHSAPFNTPRAPPVAKPQLKAHNRVSHMEVASRHVRHAHRYLVRMVPCFQLVAQAGYALATPDDKGVQLMNKKLTLVLLLMFVAAPFLALPQNAAAQDQDPSQAQVADPPTRVARLNYVQGSVSFQPAGEEDWVVANLNRPLTTGDNLWADKDSRGEIHIGATSIRLSSDTGISFLNLDDRTVQLQLAQGTIEIHLRHLEPGNAFEIDTPNLAFTLAASGEYRIQTDPDGNSTAIIVREGAGQVTGAGESYDLAAGQQYIFNGTDQLTFDAQAAPRFDDFEDWCQSQDQRENSSASARYVSRDVDGYYDLDGNGDWQTDPDYGAVWVPTGVAVGWAPYRNGHWVWIGPWGWTWVGDEPWGFAPYHYGRWAYVRGGYWGWVPGPIVVRPVYAPALVGFVGGGGGLSVAVGFGGGFAGVAWFPLGPRDVYIPGYHASPRYVQNINVTNTRVINVTQVTTVYNNYVVNRNVPGNRMDYTYARNAVAVTAVSRETFVGARPVATAAVRVTPEQLQSARVIEQTSLAPTRSSYVASNARAARTRPPVAFNEKPVVARLNPPPPAVSHAVVHTAPAVIAPRPAQPVARSAEAPPAPPAQHPNNAAPAQRPSNAAPASPMYNNDNVAHSTTKYPNTDAPANINNNSNQRPNPNTNANVNGNGNANERHNAQPYDRPNNNARPPETETAQPRPAVKYTPPIKAKEGDYDVHPPLNHNASTPPPEHHEAPAPAAHPAPATHESAPPPKPKN